MQTSAWISLALATLLPSSAIALDASSPPQRGGGSTTLDNLTLVRPGSSGPIDGMCTTAPGGSVCRTLSDRAADRLNVKDKGAKLDGSDDTAAYAAARAAAPADGTIAVPPGPFVIKATPNAGISAPILWQMSGNKFGTGTQPVIAIGKDVVESVVEGSKYFGRGASTPTSGPVVRMDSTINHVNPTVGGSSQPTMSTLKVNMVIPQNTANIGAFGWAESVTLRSSAWGDGQHVASAALAERPADALSDGKGARAVIWGHYAEVRDSTNKPANEAGSLVIAEWDMYANGTKSVPGGGQRIGHHMIFSRAVNKGEANRAAYGSQLASNDGYLGYSQADWSFVGVGYGVTLPFDVAAFDASTGLSKNNAPAFKMAEGQSILFDGSGAGGQRRLRYQSGNLTYTTQNGTAFQSADNGNFTVFNVLKAQAFSVPDQSAPSGTSDPVGSVGDVRFSGQYMYRKTTSGWLRFAGSKF